MHHSMFSLGQSSVRHVAIISIIVLLTAISTQAQQQQTTKAQSAVKGRVVYKDNSQPLKGVRIRVFKNGEPDDAGNDRVPDRVMAVTNNRGEFQLSNLSAGKYYVTVEGEGISAPSGMGMKLPLPISAIPRREDFEEIVPKHDAEFSVDGSNTVELEIAIVRGGALSGKIQQPGRAPVAGATVNLISRESASGPFNARFTTQSDRNGEYRLENLPPGEYLVTAAVENKSSNFDIRARMRGESQVVTYYPAATTARDALPVKVESGHETQGVLITLVQRGTFSVSGELIRQQDGTPVSGVMVMLRNKEEQTEGGLAPGIGQRRTQTDTNGHWSFSNVMEGAYIVAALVPNGPTVTARPGGGGPPDLRSSDSEEAYRRSRQRFLVTQQELTVAGGDVSGLSLTIAGPGSIRGTVAVEKNGSLPANFVIFLELVREGDRPAPPLPVRVEPDGSFSLDGIQGGDVFLSVVPPPGSPYFVSSVTANGQDLWRSPLRIIEGAEVGPLKVVISPELGSVSGRVLSEKGALGLSNYVVLLIPSETEKQRFRTSYLTTRTGIDGSYSLAGPPGDYFILARRREDLPPIITGNFAKSASLEAQRISLVANEIKQLELRVP